MQFKIEEKVSITEFGGSGTSKPIKSTTYFYRFSRKITHVFKEKTEAWSSPYTGDHSGKVPEP